MLTSEDKLWLKSQQYRLISSEQNSIRSEIETIEEKNGSIQELELNKQQFILKSVDMFFVAEEIQELKVELQLITEDEYIKTRNNYIAHFSQAIATSPELTKALCMKKIKEYEESVFKKSQMDERSRQKVETIEFLALARMIKESIRMALSVLMNDIESENEQEKITTKQLAMIFKYIEITNDYFKIEETLLWEAKALGIFDYPTYENRMKALQSMKTTVEHLEKMSRN